MVSEVSPLEIERNAGNFFYPETHVNDAGVGLTEKLWWNYNHLLEVAPEQLGKAAKLEKTLYFAVSSDMGELGQRFADVLTKSAPSGIHWHHEAMPDEKHSTIYHPAALKAFRSVFKPATEK
jgi:hypothetical protein